MGKVLKAYKKANKIMNVATGIAGGITYGTLGFECTLDMIDLGAEVYHTINPTPTLVKYRGKKVLVAKNNFTGKTSVYTGKNAPSNTKPIRISRKETIYGFSR